MTRLLPLLALLYALSVTAVDYDDENLSKECAPSQIHLTVGKDPSTSMMVSFSSASSCKDPKAFVMVGTEETSLNRIVAETKKPNQYNYTSPLPFVKHYTSPKLHHILVEGLEPDTKYFYTCTVKVPEDEASSRLSRQLEADSPLRQKPSTQVIRSKVLSFTTAPRAGDGLGRLKFAFVGDVGQKKASNSTVHHMARDNEIDSILLVGDVSYANTFQKKWDTWFEMMEHLISRKPMQTAPGNHEIEVDSHTKEIYVPFDNRFAMPQIRPVEKGPSYHASFHTGHDLPYDYGNAYYAYTYGAARFIILCSFTSTAHDSKQYLWLKKELQSIDRTVTPWVFVSFHVPVYNTFGSHNPSHPGQEMKNNTEKLFVSYKVNAVFSGHVHAYMRSKPVAFDKVNDKAPVYIIIGDGGFGHGSTYEHKHVEEWVAKREGKTHGFGTMDLLNTTHAYWRWVRNVDENYTKIHDHAYIENQYFL